MMTKGLLSVDSQRGHCVLLLVNWLYLEYERGLISLVFDLEACTMIDVKTRDETQACIMMVVGRIVNISSV